MLPEAEEPLVGSSLNNVRKSNNALALIVDEYEALATLT